MHQNHDTALDAVQAKDQYQKRADFLGPKAMFAPPAVPVTGNSELVQAVPSKCPHCARTRRSTVSILQDQAAAGVSPAGIVYSHLVRRHVRCAHCTSVYTETDYERR